jgi:hypothetical protein
VSTEIENFLYGKGGTHAVVEVTLSAERLILTVAPWAEPSSVKVAEFLEPRVVSVTVNTDDPDDLNLPWDIIGFDSHPLPDSRWGFVLYCGGVEYVFESRWPQLLDA